MMPNWMQEILSPSRFIPHGHCYLWEPRLVWLHLISDMLIAIAYFSIPITLVYFVRKREDVPFRNVFLLFGLFIITCGTTHLMSVWTLWHPAYWLSGVIKAITAFVSVYTALTLLPVIPAALALPSPEKMRLVNQQLEAQIEERKQAVAALKQSESQLQMALEAGKTVCWERNLDTQKIQGVGQLTGKDWQPTVWQTNAESSDWTVHPEDKERVLRSVNAAIATQGQFALEHRLALEHRVESAVNAEPQAEPQEAGEQWVLTKGKVLTDDKGHPNRLAGLTVDITDRKLAEASLKESEDRWQLALKATNDGIWDWNVDANELFVSPRLQQMLGYQADDFHGGIEAWASHIHPADVDRVRAASQAHRDGKTPFYTAEYRIRHREGYYIWVLDRGKALRDDAGNATRMTGSLSDINSRKQAETALRQLNQELEQRVEERTQTIQESERRWRSFLDNVQLMVVGLDAAGHIEYVNPCFVDQMSCAEDDTLGRNWFESFLPTSESQRVQEAFDNIINGGPLQPNYQNSIVASTGEEKLISWNTTLLKDLQGNPTGTLSIGEDVTERHAVNRMKDEFISVVSHELRTPLTSIHGALDLLATGLVDPQSERGRHVFSLAVENSDRLVKLVNDILELERLESGRIKLHKTSVSTQELTHRTSELLELVAERAGITLKVAETNVLLLADGDRLIQVLTNLVSNAIKFSEAPATIWVTVEEITTDTGKAMQFSVADEGRGIPKDKISTIFERFHQVDASDSRSKGGTGLGLAICRSIVRQHSGKIWAESTPGRGSRFIFTIPTC